MPIGQEVAWIKGVYPIYICPMSISSRTRLIFDGISAIQAGFVQPPFANQVTVQYAEALRIFSRGAGIAADKGTNEPG